MDIDETNGLVSTFTEHVDRIDRTVKAKMKECFGRGRNSSKYMLEMLKSGSSVIKESEHELIKSGRAARGLWTSKKTVMKTHVPLFSTRQGANTS